MRRQHPQVDEFFSAVDLEDVFHGNRKQSSVVTVQTWHHVELVLQGLKPFE